MSATRPLNPAPTEAELDRAAELWTLANDSLVERGYTRHLWGMLTAPAREMIILMLRAADADATALRNEIDYLQRICAKAGISTLDGLPLANTTVSNAEPTAPNQPEAR
jgi:hypothetical protein